MTLDNLGTDLEYHFGRLGERACASGDSHVVKYKIKRASFVIVALGRHGLYEKCILTATRRRVKSICMGRCREMEDLVLMEHVQAH